MTSYQEDHYPSFYPSLLLIFLLNFSNLTFLNQKAPKKHLFHTSFKFAGSKDLTSTAKIFEKSKN